MAMLGNDNVNKLESDDNNFAIARNFIGAAWMSLGAGYINPREIKAT